MTKPKGDSEAYEFAYNEGKATIDSQETTLRETRDRVGLVVSTSAALAGLASSVLVATSQPGNLMWWGVTATIVAAVGFLTVALGAIMIWLPVEGTFNWDAGLLIGSYVEGERPALLPEIHRELALHLGINSKANRDIISSKLSWFTASLAGMALEIGAIVVVMIDVSK